MKQSPNQGKNLWFYYLLVLPGVLYFIIFRYIPFLGTLVAFKDVMPFDDLSRMISAPWVGLKHFRHFVKSYYFWNILRNTFALAGLRMIFEFFFPIILAVQINEVLNSKFKKIVQTISYMPFFISNVVLAGIVFSLLSLDAGLIPKVLSWWGIEAKYYLGDNQYFRSILLSAIVWKNLGWGTIVYLAALSGVDKQLYEACYLDGGGKWVQLTKITLPSIAYAIVIMFILRVTVILNQGYEETLLLYSPSVYDTADIIDTYVYRVGVQGLKYSYATAVGLFKGLLSTALVLGANFTAKKLNQPTLFS